MKPELDDTATAAAAPTTTAASATDEVIAGTRLGHFRVERRLGAGGMGEVYLATDLALDRSVALKVLPGATTHDRSRRDRLIREARSQARISHPNVGHIYFIGEEAGRLYFAMEYVAGETLAERVARGGPMAVEDALAAIRSAALGLREAHRSGFTHRDVKPSNLMIDGHAMVKVLDFGLVASGPEAEPGDSAPAAAPIAQTSFGGTPLYMAPEQGRGDPIDFRADIYALGATLYHLVSGAPPFAADTVEALLSMHATAQRPAVPRGRVPRGQLAAVDALCARMMAPLPGDRFASYDELLRAIELASIQHTRPAGFWVRLVAATFDMLIVVAPILVVIAVITRLVLDDYDVEEAPFTYTAILAFSIAFVARFGRTPGKTLLELEIVAIDTGARPSWAQATTRAVVMLGPATVLAWIAAGFELADSESLATNVFEAANIGMTFLMPLVLLVSTLRGANKRAPWDRVARTLVRYRTSRAA